MTTKGYFKAAGSDWDEGDGELEITAVDGKIVVSVTDECAVDSYNSEFTCSCALEPDDARKLLAFLQVHLSVTA